jgi:PiT family inorganic phosphate transporter
VGAIATGLLTLAALRSGSVQASFARLQIVTAGCVAFAHGSNDVGNAIAPLSVILTIQRTQQVPLHSAALPLWVLGVGAGGIVLGLVMAGGRVIQTVGKEILQLDPSQGFAAEFATAATVLLASRLGLPVSTSHALVGAVVGVGLARLAAKPSHASAIQGKTLRPIALAWGVTVPAAAALSGAIALGLIQLRQTIGG